MRPEADLLLAFAIVVVTAVAALGAAAMVVAVVRARPWLHSVAAETDRLAEALGVMISDLRRGAEEAEEALGRLARDVAGLDRWMAELTETLAAQRSTMGHLTRHRLRRLLRVADLLGNLARIVILMRTPQR